MCATPVSVAMEAGKNFRMDDVDRVIAKVSARYGLPYISNYDAFLRYSKEANVTIDSLLSDGLHPNDLGYKVLYQNICRHVGIPILRDDLSY